MIEKHFSNKFYCEIILLYFCDMGMFGFPKLVMAILCFYFRRENSKILRTFLSNNCIRIHRIHHDNPLYDHIFGSLANTLHSPCIGILHRRHKMDNWIHQICHYNHWYHRIVSRMVCNTGYHIGNTMADHMDNPNKKSSKWKYFCP